ncbi:uncharacterized protein LTR77_000277 [Saxophila tyrrhenica]|uniref:Uncharacterized protein n=1 Tax=Saxophila tyrrhenica TaxID=1690608 RepID=A0AAV9PNP8_9PEZI|nr:hypothetical protein LTR77_000277 [Saxophila tyrrhenica]
MVDMSTTSAGLAWGMPVRPDLLGQALEAYEKFLPVSTTLRLCHCFGKGTNMNINKLPIELLSAIEDVLFHDLHLKKSTWIESFKHFEHRCEPSDHPIAASEAEFCAMEEGPHRCEDCDEDEPGSPCSGCGCYHGPYEDHDCEDCKKVHHEVVNDILMERIDWYLEECPELADGWETLISQRVNGNFAKYDQILYKHFGLAAYFARTRITDEELKKWPEDNNHDLHYGEPLQTTTCFITLPRQAGESLSYGITEVEGSNGFADVAAAQSLLVDLPILRNKEQTSKQFHRLLRTLELQPYVHESQLRSRISAQTVPITKVTGGTKDSSQDVNKSRNKAAFDKMEWPQLVMLVQTSFQWPD